MLPEKNNKHENEKKIYTEKPVLLVFFAQLVKVEVWKKKFQTPCLAVFVQVSQQPQPILGLSTPPPLKTSASTNEWLPTMVSTCGRRKIFKIWNNLWDLSTST